MDEKFIRHEMLVGDSAIQRLSTARVAVFGIGGVGGYVIETLARSGVGSIDIVDGDTVAESNINRQILALDSTIGMKKVCVAARRLIDINSQILVSEYPVFFKEENYGDFNLTKYDYVVDAIDMVSSKIRLIGLAKDCGTPIISCMGAGNRLSPMGFTVADISQTKICPLARIMRRELRRRGIYNVKVVYSSEKPVEAAVQATQKKGERPAPGSNAFAPAAAGLLLASEVVKDLLGGGD